MKKVYILTCNNRIDLVNTNRQTAINNYQNLLQRIREKKEYINIDKTGKHIYPDCDIRETDKKLYNNNTIYSHIVTIDKRQTDIYELSVKTLNEYSINK